jgi:hypothetical protein
MSLLPITKELIESIKHQLSNLVTDAINIEYHCTTKTHIYFDAYDEFFKEEISIRVDRFTGKIETTVHREDSFMWWNIEKKVVFNWPSSRWNEKTDASLATISPLAHDIKS